MIKDIVGAEIQPGSIIVCIGKDRNKDGPGLRLGVVRQIDKCDDGEGWNYFMIRIEYVIPHEESDHYSTKRSRVQWHPDRFLVIHNTKAFSDYLRYKLESLQSALLRK